MTAPTKFSPPKEDFTVWESRLGGQLGISRDDVRELRQKHLVESQDWIYDRNRVVLSAPAVEKLRAALKLETAAPINARPGSPSPPPEVETNAAQRHDAAQAQRPSYIFADSRPLSLLKVWRATRNPQIVECYRLGTDPYDRSNVVRLRIRPGYADRFPQHWEVPAFLVEMDLYELARALPRARGRW